MEDMPLFYFEVNSTDLPSTKEPKTLLDQPLLSEHVQSDFPLVCTFWGDGSLSFPKHPCFPVYVQKKTGGFSISFRDTSQLLGEDSAVPQREEGDPNTLPIGWPDGQTLTSIDGYSTIFTPPSPRPSDYTGSYDPDELQTHFRKSCHPPKLYAAPDSFIAAPKTVRVIVCNLDRPYRPKTNTPPAQGNILPFVIGTSMVSNVVNVLCGLVTIAPFSQIGMVLHSSAITGAPRSGIGVEIDSGQEIFTEDFGEDWAKQLVEFDEKWRATTRKLAEKFPDLNFQLVPLTPEGLADYVLATSAPLLPPKFQQWMIPDYYGSVLSAAAFSSSLAGKFLNACTPAPIPSDGTEATPEASALGAIYGDVLNLVIVRASHATSTTSYWSIKPTRSASQGVVDYTLNEGSVSLIGTDLDKEGDLYAALQADQFQNFGIKFLMDDGVLDVSQYQQYEYHVRNLGHYNVNVIYDFDGTDTEDGAVKEGAWYVTRIYVEDTPQGDLDIFSGGSVELGSGSYNQAGLDFVTQANGSPDAPSLPDWSTGSSSSFESGLRYPGTYTFWYASHGIIPGFCESASSFGHPPGAFSGNAGSKSPGSDEAYGEVVGFQVAQTPGRIDVNLDPGNGKDLSSLTERALKLVVQKADPIFRVSYEDKVNIDDPIGKLVPIISSWFQIAPKD